MRVGQSLHKKLTKRVSREMGTGGLRKLGDLQVKGVWNRPV